MKKTARITLAVLLLVFLSTGSWAAKAFISIATGGTGGTGGTYYPLGGGIAEIVTRKVPDFQVTSETGNASAANIMLIGTRQVEMALVQNDVAYWASRGMQPFREKVGKYPRRCVLYPEHLHCIILKESGINDI